MTSLESEAVETVQLEPRWVKQKKSRAATHKLSRAPTQRVHCIENIVDGNKYVEQSQPTDKDEIIAKIQLHNSEWKERDGKKMPTVRNATNYLWSKQELREKSS